MRLAFAVQEKYGLLIGEPADNQNQMSVRDQDKRMAVRQERKQKSDVGGTGRRLRLLAEGPNGRVHEHVMLRLTVVGRDPVCDVCLEGRKISRRHLTLDWNERGELVLRDLDSHNGTHVAGKRISELVLQGSESIQAGEWKIRLLPDRRKTLPVPEDLPVITDDFGADDHTLDLTDPSHAKLNEAVTAMRAARNAVWSWEQKVETAPERFNKMPLDANPIVAKLRSTSTGRLDLRDIGNLKNLSRTLDARPPAESMEAVALSLLYRVMAELHRALTLEEFLGSIAGALLEALQGQGVAILRPEGAFGEMQPTVVRLAERIGSLKLSQTVVEAAVRERAAVAAANAANDTRFASGESVLRLDLRAVLCVPLVRDAEIEGAIYVTRERPFAPADQELVGALGHIVGLGIEQARMRDQVQKEAALRSMLERFHTPEVVEKLMLTARASDGSGIQPFLEALEATIVFCDLSSFTAFSERHPPGRVANLLNAYLSRMTEVIRDHRGTVDKYIGDAVMAIFGAPFPAEDDALRAVACALAMRSAFNAVIADRPPEERLRVRIGVNTGPVVAGLIGSKMQMQYTALGDAVNVASRLEAAAEPGQILIGPRTMELVQGKFLIQKRGPLVLKGKAEPVEVFEVVAPGALQGV